MSLRLLGNRASLRMPLLWCRTSRQPRAREVGPAALQRHVSQHPIFSTVSEQSLSSVNRVMKSSSLLFTAVLNETRAEGQFLP